MIFAGRARIVIAGLPLCFLPGVALAQALTNPPDQPVATKPDQPAVSDDANAIVVTGSRGLERTVTKSPTPIDVIQAQDIARTGKTGALEALSVLVPSFDVPARAGGQAGSIILTGGLRGLSPDQTLILVNGKRRHKTALINAGSALYNGSDPADLGLIPVSAIDHIEVLRDGAAAKYGSDAIAGVINVIEKHSTGVQASFSAGQNFDRSDGQLYQADVSAGAELGQQGMLNLFVQAKDQQASNRATPISSSILLYPLINGQPDPRESTIDRLVSKSYGVFPQKTLNTGYNAHYDIGEQTLYSFATLSFRKSFLNSTFRAPNNIASLPQLYPNGFRPGQVIDEADFQANLGLRGTVAGWDYDASTGYGRSRGRFSVNSTLNPSLGPTSPTSFYLGTYVSTEWVNSLDLTRGYNIGGNLQVSAGVEHRRETYRILSGDPSSYANGGYVIPVGQYDAGQMPPPGSQPVPGATPSDAGYASRNNISTYIDLAYDPSKRITLGAAGRFEHFDDASGNTFNYQGNARYALTDWLALRGSAGTGFRAPALAQEIYSSTIAQFQIINGQTAIVNVKTLPVSSPAAVALGAKPLTPERSTDFSAGMVLTPARALSITVDAYSVKVRNKIAITGTLGGPQISAILAANNLPTNINAQYFTNGLGTRTQGIDAVATYRIDLGADWGKLRLTASMALNKTKITNIAANPPQLASLGSGYVLFSRQAQGYITEVLPKTKLLFSPSWEIGRFTTSVREVYYGGYTDPGTVAANDRHYGGKWITDLEVGLQVSKVFNLAIGASNLFNTYPDKVGIVSTTLGTQQYGATPFSPFGFTGGFYYGRISMTL